MRPTFHNLSTVLTLAVLLATASAFAASAADDKTPAQDAEADASILRICAAANEAPYSMSNGTGFENRIAEAVAKAMGRKADFVWSDRPAIYIVRDQLDPASIPTISAC
jgi:mxaJ protein